MFVFFNKKIVAGIEVKIEYIACIASLTIRGKYHRIETSYQGTKERGKGYLIKKEATPRRPL